MNKSDFKEGTALVVGGSGGVGSAICVALAEAGCDIALTYFGNEARAEAVAGDVRAHGRAASIHQLDLRDASAVERVVAAAAGAGPLHTVVYASGPDIAQRYLSEVTGEEWRQIMEADATGFFELVRCALPHLREAAGSLVAVTTAGLSRYPARDVLSVAPKAAKGTNAKPAFCSRKRRMSLLSLRTKPSAVVLPTRLKRTDK